MKLPNITLLIVVAMFTIPSVSVSAPRLTGGPKIGLNSATVSTELETWDGYGTPMHYNSKIGINVGGFITFSVTDMFAVQSEILFPMKGRRYEKWYITEYLHLVDCTSEVDEEGKTHIYCPSVREFDTVNYSYLEIPVLTKLSIVTLGSASFNLFVGPALAIKLNSSFKHELGEGYKDTGILRILKLEEGGFFTENRHTDFGLVWGGSVDFNLGQEKFVVDVRYTLGLTSIFSVLSEKNRVISVTIGYYF